MVNIDRRLIDRLRQSGRIVFLSGAGISANNGVTASRDIWSHSKKYRPADLASVAGFLRHPDIVWQWYRQRIAAAMKTEPNPGHRAIAQMESIFEKVTVITQNVDGMHQRAGSTQVVELHGNFLRCHCLECGHKDPRPTTEITGEVPKCSKCDGLLRPSVIWFAEPLPQEELAVAFAETSSCDVLFSVGNSSVVFPAAQLPHDAKRRGALTIEINLAPTALTPSVDVFLEGSAAEILPPLVRALA